MQKKVLNIGMVGFMVIGMFFLPSSLVAAAGTKIKPNYIKVNNNKYRRAGAESATLGAIGLKKARVTKVAYFDRDSVWKAGKVGVEISRPIAITSTQVKEFEGNVATVLNPNMTTGTLRVSGASIHSASFSIVKMTFKDNGEVIRAFNSRLSKNERKRIKRLGTKKLRMITSVWVLISGDERSMSRLEGTATVEDRAGNSAAITIRQNSTTTVSFGSGSIVAYEYDKMKWKTGKKVLKKLERDGVWL